MSSAFSDVHTQQSLRASWSIILTRTQLAHRGLAGYHHLQESQSCILLEDYADFKMSPAILLGWHACDGIAWRLEEKYRTPSPPDIASRLDLAEVTRPALDTAAAREHGCEATGDMVRASKAPPLAAPPGGGRRWSWRQPRSGLTRSCNRAHLDPRPSREKPLSPI